jgi:hypothetical protein
MVPADLAVERADQQPVGAQESDQQVLHRALAGDAAGRRSARPSRPRAASTSAPSWSYDDPADAGSARTTSTAARGRERIRDRRRCRSRRFTRLRVTALPTALLTTKPTCGTECSTGPSSFAVSVSRCRTTVRVPARRPLRAAVVNRLEEVSRCGRSSTGSARRRSDRELVATLATARGQDGAAGAGTHPQAKAVGLVPAAVVRLERALAHGSVSGVCDGLRWCEVWVNRCVAWHRPSAESILVSARGRSTIEAATWPSGVPWTCGTGRHRFDRPTVRGGDNTGQTSEPVTKAVDNRLIRSRPPC